MSWLGVNLNDSLGSLKGQLSNLTRQVLSEGLDEGEGRRAVPPLPAHTNPLSPGYKWFKRSLGKG